MRSGWAYIPVCTCLVWNAAQAAPQAAPSAVSIKQFRDVPVEMATGEYVRREGVDLSLKSVGGRLEVLRNYRSQRETRGLFGYGWSWNHAERLEFPGDFIIHYVTPDAIIPVYPDVSYTSTYAKVCYSSPGWGGGAKATGLPDATGGYGNVAHFYGVVGSLQPLVVGGWNFQIPDGPSSILQVDLTSIGATAYDLDHPQYGLGMKLSAGGANSVTWGHRAYNYDAVNITSDHSDWSWQDLNAVQARLELASYKQNVALDVVVDTFHLGVTYTRNASGEFKYQPGTMFTLVKTNNEYWILNRNLTRLEFSLDGKLLRKRDASGNRLLFHYDDAGRLVHITDDIGQVLTLRYDNDRIDAKVITLSDHLGRFVSYVYAGDDLVAVTNMAGGVTRYDYDSAQPPQELRHNMTRRIDPMGFGVSCAYHTTNGTPDRVSRFWDGEVTEGRSNEVDFLYLKGTTYSFIPGSGCIQGVVYNASNDISQVYLREGEMTHQASDSVNLIAEHSPVNVASSGTSVWENIECVSGPADGLLAHASALDSNNVLRLHGWGFSVPGMSNDIVQVLLSMKGMASNPVCLSAMGVMTTNWSSSSLDWVTLNLTGDRSHWTWADISNLTAQVSLPRGATNPAEVWLDAFSLKVSYRHFDPGRDPTDVFYFYDLAHNVVSREQDGVVHQFSYDERGNLTSWTDPEGGVRRYEYDPVLNRPVRAQDALGRVTVMEYDAQGRLIKTTDASGGVAVQEYDDHGNLVCSTYPDGTSESSTYDTNGVNVIKTRNRRGNETRFDYDMLGNCTRITDAMGNHRQARYDRSGLKLRECDEAGVETRFEYDLNGRLTKTVTAADTHEETSVRHDYDGRGLLVSITDPLGQRETMAYDAYGRAVCRVDKTGGRTLTDYDRHDNVIRVCDARDQTCEYKHDGRGNTVFRSDKRGAVTTVAYNGNNVPVSSIDAGGNRTETRYDSNGNVLAETLFAVGYPGCQKQDIPEPLITAYAVDSLNRVTNTIVGAGRSDAKSVTTFYDRAGRVTLEIDPLGNSKRTAYDANGNPTNSTLTDRFGNMVSQTRRDYDEADHQLWEIKGVGSLTVTNQAQYDARGLKCLEIDPLGRRTAFVYDRHRRLVSSRRPDNTVHSITYDGAGNKLVEGVTGGAVTRYVWDAAGRLTNIITGVGLEGARSVSYELDSLGHVLREIDPLGGVTLRSYDGEGNVTKEVNPLGIEKFYYYDALGRVTNTVDGAGFSTRQIWDGRGKLCQLVDALGRVTISKYDVYGRLVSLADPLGNLSHWGYDKNDNIISEEDARGLVIRSDYDASGHVTNRIRGVGVPVPQAMACRYDALGREIMRINPDGGCVSQAYDPVGNVVARTDPRGAVTRYVYDVMDRLIATHDAADGVCRTAYDGRGNVTAETDAMGARVRYTYDGFNLRRSMTDALGMTTWYDYDRMGRVTNIVDALGGRESRCYDAAGQLISSADKNGAGTTYEYDALGRLVRTADALGFQTWKHYDAVGNVVGETDKRGYSTTTSYDALNRPVMVTDPASNSLTLRYDEMGNKTREVWASGKVTVHGYDLLRRLVVVTVGAGCGDARSTRYAYDAMDRRVREDDPLGRSVTIQYDANGNKTNVTDRRGFSTRMEYDVLNRLVKTTDALGIPSSVEYDKVGRVVKTTNRRGRTTLHTYDAAGQLTSIQDAEGHVSSNLYDTLGRRCEEIAPNGLRTAFGYDAVGRMISRTAGAGSIGARTQRFTYDALGRRCGEVDALGGVTTYNYDPNGNATTVSVYSAAGQLLRKRHVEYNSRNLPEVSVDYLGNAWTTGYDAMGRRTSEMDPLGNRTTYELNIFDEVASVTDPCGNRTTTKYDRCGRICESVNALGQSTRYGYDAHGNNVAVIDDNGRVVLTSYDGLNRAVSINRAMPSIPYDELRRADVNHDGSVDEFDRVAFEEALP